MILLILPVPVTEELKSHLDQVQMNYENAAKCLETFKGEFTCFSMKSLRIRNCNE